MNYYGTQKHKNRIKELDERVFSKIDFTKPETEKKLGNGYAVRYYFFSDEKNRKPGYAPARGVIGQLYMGGKLLYTWKNTDGAHRL